MSSVVELPIALRLVLGLAVAGQVFVTLASFGALNGWTIACTAACTAALWAAVPAAFRRRSQQAIGPVPSAPGGTGECACPPPAGRRWVLLAIALQLVLMLALALFPPIAFDETLYHLPFVRAMATSGGMHFLPTVRFPIFPQLHEALCVPAFLLGGGTATHLVALLEVALLAALLAEEHSLLAAALVLGHPIVVQFGTVTYVDVALMLFIAAGFLCRERYPAISGFLLGTACSVKYTGWYFAGALFFAGAGKKRYLGAFALAVLPMYARLVVLTGNPFYPYPNAVTTPTVIVPLTRVVNAVRLAWDVTFARDRLNHQPPYSPLFAVALIATLIAARRDRRTALLAAICLGYLAAFTFLPADSRYLMPLLPIVSVVAASYVRHPKAALAFSLLAIAPGIAYAGYRLVRQGPPPLGAARQQRYLEAHIPEYRALEHRGPGPIYVCGAEQLKYFGGDELTGDLVDPCSNGTVFGKARTSAELRANLKCAEALTPRPSSLGPRPSYLLISHRACPADWQRLPQPPEFERVYTDAGATLWRVAVSPTATR